MKIDKSTLKKILLFYFCFLLVFFIIYSIIEPYSIPFISFRGLSFSTTSDFYRFTMIIMEFVAFITYFFIGFKILKKSKTTENNLTAFTLSWSMLFMGFSRFFKLFRNLFNINHPIVNTLFTRFNYSFLALSTLFYFFMTLEVFKNGINDSKNRKNILTLLVLISLFVLIFSITPYTENKVDFDYDSFEGYLLIGAVLIALLYFFIFYVSVAISSFKTAKKVEEKTFKKPFILIGYYGLIIFTCVFIELYVELVRNFDFPWVINENYHIYQNLIIQTFLFIISSILSYWAFIYPQKRVNE